MSKLTRESALAVIRSNIARHGHHVYQVLGGDLPRYVYTIGLSGRVGAELILTGAAFFSGTEAVRIVNAAAAQPDFGRTSFTIEPFGRFVLRKELHRSWISALMLGALDFYGAVPVHAWQVLPEPAHWTLDIPDMRRPWSAAGEPVWQWRHVPWPYQAPSTSSAVTNLAALRGERITEAARWEDEQWELFAGAGPDVPEDQLRVVPLGTLLGADPSLAQVLSLAVGGALWRDPQQGAWQLWEDRSRPDTD